MIPWMATLGITTWLLIDFRREQTLVDRALADPAGTAGVPARILAGELRWQFRMTLLVVLQVAAGGVTVVLLWRALRRSRTSLRDTRARTADVLDGMDQAVLTTDRDGVLTSVNRRGAEMFGPAKQLLGQPIDRIEKVPLAAIRRRRIGPAADPPQGSWPAEEVSVGGGEDGDDRIWSIVAGPLRDGNGRTAGHVWQVRDVTAAREMESRVRRLERYLGLGPLAAGLHHEIKNPLAAVSLHVQLLGEAFEQDAAPAGHRRTLDVIATELSRIGRVLDSFRDFAAVDRMDRLDVSLVDIAARQVRLVEPAAERGGIEIRRQLDLETPTITGDPNRLEQVVANLIANAIEAMPGGGVLTVRVGYRPSRGDEATDVWCEVIDTGGGIPDDHAAKIFDPYFTTKPGGTGLGLAISDKIIRRHDGTLTHDRTDETTRFRLTLQTPAPPFNP